MRILDTSCPLVVGLAGVEVTPGPFHWMFGVSVTPGGRVIEQLRVTVSPATMDEEGEVVREISAATVDVYSCNYIHACALKP